MRNRTVWSPVFNTQWISSIVVNMTVERTDLKDVVTLAFGALLDEKLRCPERTKVRVLVMSVRRQNPTEPDTSGDNDPGCLELGSGNVVVEDVYDQLGALVALY